MLRPYPGNSSRKKTKKVWSSCPTFPIFFFPPWGNSLDTIFFGIKEALTLTKFQDIYLSKAFLDFEADVKERAHGIEEEKKILAYRP